MSSSDIQTIINTLSDKLGPIGKVVWEAYVRQQYIIGYTQLAFSVLLLILATVSGKIAYTAYRNMTLDDGSDDNVMVAVVSGLVAITVLIVAFGLATDGIGHLINPSYGAVQGLLGR